MALSPTSPGASRQVTYVDHIRSLPCLVCKAHGVDAHHMMVLGGRGMGMKSPDDTCVPLCHEHHMELHAQGDEYRFWDFHGVNPIDWRDKELEWWERHQNAKDVLRMRIDNAGH